MVTAGFAGAWMSAVVPVFLGGLAYAVLRPTSQRVRCDTKRVTVARGAAMARHTCRSTRSRSVRVRVGRAGGAWHGILTPISRLLAPPYRF